MSGLTKPFLLTGLSIIFKPSFLSRILPDQLCNSFATILSDKSLDCALFLGARANYMHSLVPVKGFLETRCFFSGRIRFCSKPFVTAKGYYTHPRQGVKEFTGKFGLFKVKDSNSLREKRGPAFFFPRYQEKGKHRNKFTALLQKPPIAQDAEGQV